MLCWQSLSLCCVYFMVLLRLNRLCFERKIKTNDRNRLGEHTMNLLCWWEEPKELWLELVLQWKRFSDIRIKNVKSNCNIYFKKIFIEFIIKNKMILCSSVFRENHSKIDSLVVFNLHAFILTLWIIFVNSSIAFLEPNFRYNKHSYLLTFCHN